MYMYMHALQICIGQVYSMSLSGYSYSRTQSGVFKVGMVNKGVWQTFGFYRVHYR